jgi:hypothetical protein
MRGSHHACFHNLANSTGTKSRISGVCRCDNCERTLATQPARPKDAAIALGIAPQFTYVQEFYNWPSTQRVVRNQSQRAPPAFSIQRVKYFGSRISSTVHRLTAAVWPL